MENSVIPAHRHFVWPVFNRSHTELHLARTRGAKWADYLPLLERANNDARWFSMMIREWGDPVC